MTDKKEEKKVEVKKVDYRVYGPKPDGGKGMVRDTVKAASKAEALEAYKEKNKTEPTRAFKLGAGTAAKKRKKEADIARRKTEGKGSPNPAPTTIKVDKKKDE